MSDLWYINGGIGQTFPPDNRGLAYGDGLFESMRVIGGKIPLLGQHLSRLKQGADALGLQLNADLIKTWISDAVFRSGFQQAVIKLICVRKGSALGYKAAAIDADILLRASELKPPIPRLALKAKVCDLRLSAQPALAGIKHLNRLEQVLASQELSEDYDEGLLLDEQGHIVEAVSSNLVFIQNNELIFPDLAKSGVQGVMQHCLKQLLPDLGMGFTERSISLRELQNTDEILLTNAIRGIRNLVSIEGYWHTERHETGEKLRRYLADSQLPGFTSF